MCSSHTVSGVLPGSARATRHSLVHRIRAVSSAGYSGYWIHYRDFLEQRAAGLSGSQIRMLFDDSGLEERGVEFLTNWFVGDQASIAAEDAALAGASAIGARWLSVGADFENRGIDPSRMLREFERLCRRAAAFDIQVALEIVPWSSVADIESALAYLQPNNAGLVIDCWHIFRGGIPLSDICRVPAEKIYCVQVNDAEDAPRAPLPIDTVNRLQCGEGAFDLDGFARTLDRHGVVAPYSVEIISPAQSSLELERAASLSLIAARSVFATPRSSASA